MEIICAGEMWGPYVQTFWNVPSTSVRSETDRLVTGVPFGSKRSAKSPFTVSTFSSYDLALSRTAPACC